MISLASVEVPPQAYINVLKCLATKRIGQGSFIREFEERIEKLFKVKHCIAVYDGSLADTVMLIALKTLHPNKTEVIMPALTFVAQANAVLQAGLTPVFIDSENNRVTMDRKLADKAINDNTLCMFPTHLLGYECDMSFHNEVPVLEDACEAMGGFFEQSNIRFGCGGTAGAFSLFPSHLITTGEGGFITTNDDEFASLCRSIRNHGKIGQDFRFQCEGMNAKWTNIQAGIGCALVDRIDYAREKRIENFNAYNHYLGLNQEIPDSPHAYPYECENVDVRDSKLMELKLNGIEARQLMSCIPDLPHFILKQGFRDAGEFVNARRFANNWLFVPCHQFINDEQIEKVANVLAR